MKQKGFIVVCLLFVAAVLAAQEAGLLKRSIAIQRAEEAEQFNKNLDSRDPYYGLYRGIALHNSGAGNASSLETAEELLLDCFQQTGSAIAMGYRGSVITLKASLAFEKGDFIAATFDLQHGLELIDSAVAMQPESIVLRFLRVINGLDVTESSPTSRTADIHQDIVWLEENDETLALEEKAHLYLVKGRLAILEEKYDEAYTFLEKAVKTAPGSITAHQADDLLWSLEE